MSLLIEYRDVCDAAKGDWILEACEEEQNGDEFLLSCISLILKQPDAKPRLIKFMRVMADKLEKQDV